MRGTIKEEGITLITLTITVIVLLVLAGITTYTGISSIKSSKLTKFKQQLEIMQAQVDMLYEKYKNDDGTLNEEEINKIGKDLSFLDTEEVDDIFNQVYSIDSIDSINKDTYRYYDKETIEELGISGIDDEYLVSIHDRLVISITGIENDGILYRVLYQFPDKERVGDNFERGEVSFLVDTEETSNGFKINISNIKYSKYVGKGNIQYRKSTSSDWIVAGENVKDKNYSFNLTSSGKYIIKITDAAGISSEQEFVILRDGEVFDETPWELTGDGTEVNPYLIQSIEDLVAFSNSANEGEYYRDKYVKLETTLDFNSDSSYYNPNTKVSEKTNRIIKEDSNGTPLKEFLTTGTGFNPIGNFSGFFNGNGKEIKNIYINRPEESEVALFSYHSEVIEKLGLTGNIIGGEDTGGISARGTIGSIVRYCYNKASVTGKRNVSGIDTGNAEILYCFNSGKITGSNSVGGIACASANALKCYNYGEIIGEDYFIGGISLGGTVDSCYNLGNVNAPTAYGVGGIVGTSVTTIKNSYNSGNIIGKSGVGAVLGNYQANQDTVENCYYLKGSATGGINGQDIIGQAEPLEESQMPEVIDVVQSQVEIDGQTINVWKEDINNGYPILFWQ